MRNLTSCDKFQPIILDGQMCYSLNVANNSKKSSKAGKKGGLFLLLDPSPYQMSQSAQNLDEEYDEQNSFKVYIHTLAQNTAYGPGIYSMNSLKSMTGKESFKQLPDSLKKCHVQNREDCQTNKFLEQVKDNCNCTAWPLITDYSKSKVIM